MTSAILTNEEFLYDLLNCQNKKAPDSLGLKKKKFIGHFDINGTIIGTDKVTDRDVYNIAQEALGRRLYDYWPMAGGTTKFMSYREYVCDYCLKGKVTDKRLKKEKVVQMGELLKTLKEMNSDYLDLAQKVVLAFAEKCNGQLFPSFSNLIKRMKMEKQPFQLHLHTFGSDIKISDTITKDLGIKFADTIVQQKAVFQNIQKDHQMQRIYNLCSDKNYLFQHDWKYWNANNERGRYGKMIPMNPKDYRQISIFFDDNIKRSILDPTSIGVGFNVTNDRYLTTQDQLDSGHFVNVNTVEVALDPHYFERKIEKATSA